MRFTQEEFDIMIDELIYRKEPSFDMLCHIAQKTLWHSIEKWCKKDKCLEGLEVDLMHDIHLHLMKRAVPGFLQRNGIDTINRNPEGFEDWLYTVGRNLKEDKARRRRIEQKKTKDLDVEEFLHIAAKEPEDQSDRIERLQKSFSIVICSSGNVYIPLTWIAQFIFVLESDIKRSQANKLIVKSFSEKTLYEMYDMILVASKRIPWIRVDKTQHEKILASLQKTWKDDLAYGKVKYKNFFMKYKGEVSGEKSVSDWVNRMDGMIKRKWDNKPADKNKLADEKKKGRGKDEPSHD